MQLIPKKITSVIKTLANIKREHGIFKVFFYIYQKLMGYISFIFKFSFTLPIAVILIILRPFKEINLIMLLSSRIGHFSENTELMLLSQHKEIFSKKRIYLFYEEKIICNTQLSKMWKRVLPVLPFPRVCREIDNTLCLLLGQSYKLNPVKAFESCLLVRDHQNLLETKEKPFLYFTRDEIIDAEKQLSEIGIQRDKPFVCLLVRDAGYLNHRNPGKNLFGHHNCRDADVTNYKKAALFLAEKGYTVFRMGKHVEKRFDVNHPAVIDYANHPRCSDLLDIYLPAHCSFMISTATGLDGVAQIFRRPLLFTDLLPIFNQLQFWYPCVMYIPKKIRYKDTNQVLSFKELEKELTILELNMQNTLAKKNLEIIPNTENEILDAVIEMELRITNNWIETEESKKLQNMILKNSFPSTIIYEQFRFSLEKIKVTLGENFCSENKELFV